MSSTFLQWRSYLAWKRGNQCCGKTSSSSSQYKSTMEVCFCFCLSSYTIAFSFWSTSTMAANYFISIHVAHAVARCLSKNIGSVPESLVHGCKRLLALLIKQTGKLSSQLLLLNNNSEPGALVESYSKATTPAISDRPEPSGSQRVSEIDISRFPLKVWLFLRSYVLVWKMIRSLFTLSTRSGSSMKK